MDDVHPTVPTAPPTLGGLVTVWTLQPVALVLAAVAVAAYARGVVRTPNWPVLRTTSFGVGVALWVWTTCGFLEVYGHVLFWVWTVQVLLLLLVAPLLVMGGQPLELARRRGSRLGRAADSRVGRALTSPMVGPLLVPLASAGLVFGPLAGLAAAHPPAEWALQVAVLLVGAAIALPLVTSSNRLTSLAVGVALAIGLFELLLDAIPGIVLRLQTHITTSFFDLRPGSLGVLSPIRDQERAGGILWVLAELLDLPFLLLVFRQWLRVDAREAQTVDTVLEAEAIARRAGSPGSAGAPTSPGSPDAGNRGDAGPQPGDLGETTPPWWTSDPRLRDRYR